MSITILGGGISGLSAAFYLSARHRGTKVQLYEAASRFGGWIKTDQKDGYIFEAGPRTIRPKGFAGNCTLEMIELLGLSKKVVPIRSNHIAAKNRMIYVNKQLCLLPNSIKGVMNIVPPFSKPLYKAGLKDLFGRKSKKPLEDESIYDFAARRFGKELADYAVSSMICGICAGDAKEISVKFLMKNLFEKEQKFGGVIKGILWDYVMNGSNRIKPPSFTPTTLFQKAKDQKWSIYSLEGGLETLPKTIVEKLSDDISISMNLNAKCDRIKFETGGPVQVTVNGINHSTKHLISSLPSFQLAQLVNHQHPKLASELNSIKCVDVAVINLHYPSELLEQEGFGLLVPPIENLPILGIIFDSCCFKMEGQTVLTVMCGGKWFEKWFGDNPTEKQLLEVALANVKKILNIEEKPDRYKVNIMRKCIPQYVVGHHARVERIRKYIDDHKLPLSLCGASFDGVGVNDVIVSAVNAAKRIVEPQTEAIE
jgi:protoporphyrinogen/coproporphyrinogen III oxidase